MAAAPEANGALSVIKIGGGLTGVPEALDRVCAAVGKASREHRIVVVPGGGPFADAVRAFESRVGISPHAAHWMAILAMDQYAHVLVGRIPGAVLVDQPGDIPEVVASRRVAVLAPSHWMRSADVLPHSWEVTSDSIAAFVAGALDAARLLLIKPSDRGDRLDPYFNTALPAGMSCLVVACDRIDELSEWLSG
jgi:5-(aminomethyl)-3-furanmethanol phosphate kinase